MPYTSPLYEEASLRRILGIDPGLASSGFGIIECTPRSMQLLCYGVIETQSSMEQGQRLCLIYDELSSLMARYKPREVAMEGLYFSRNVSSALAVAQAMGVLTLCIQKQGLPLSLYTPNNIKLSVTGSARADKKLVEQSIGILLRVEQKISPSHAADALAVAITHYNSYNGTR